MTGHAYQGTWTLSDLLDDRAERYGGLEAVATLRDRLTFGGLRDRAQRVAAGLQGLGVGAGDRVATMLDPGLAYLAAWFGSGWAGAIEVPVNTAYKGVFLEHVLRESEAKVLVTDARFVGRLAEVEAPELVAVVVVGGEADLDAVGDRQVMRFEDALGLAPAPMVRRREDEMLYVLYTSGTTGPSKGVMHVNRSALWNARIWLDILELTHEDVAYSMFPLFHVTARSAVVTASIWARGRVALREGFTLQGFWDDVRSSGATFFAYMGAVITLLHKQPPREDDADNALRVAFGAAAPPDVVEDFQRRFGVELLEVYGSTELGPASAPRPGKVKRGTMGRPCEHLQVQIHDEHDRPLGPGEVGEIVARPAVPYGLHQGYWRQPEHSLQAFRNLWFHTGDGGLIDDEGYLVFTDRIKDSLRRRGENISSFEVERAVNAHDQVLEAAAYALPSELTEDEVAVAVVPVDGDHIDPEQLLRFCARTMPRFTVPRYLRILDELPKTPSQRVQKYLLREQGITPDTIDRHTLDIEIPRD
jgi:carnitine-CoA ligase